MVCCVLWPFLAVIVILGVMPKWRKNLLNDIMPKSLINIRDVAYKFINNVNNTTNN